MVFFLFPFHAQKHVLLRKLELSVFHYSRSFYYINSVWPFFNLFLLPFRSTWHHFCSHTSRLVTSFFYLLHIRMVESCLLFSSLPSFFLLVRRLRRSLSIRRCSRCRFLYCICSFLFRVASASPIPIQVFHARKRALSYFSRLPFSRVRPAIARKRASARSGITRYTWHFPFSFSVCTPGIRYVIHSTLSRYCPFLARKVHSLGVSCFRAALPLPRLLLRFFAASPEIPGTSLLRRWAILENTIRSIPTHYPR